jgi:hypothetical protein
VSQRGGSSLGGARRGRCGSLHSSGAGRSASQAPPSTEDWRLLRSVVIDGTGGGVWMVL